MYASRALIQIVEALQPLADAMAVVSKTALAQPRASVFVYQFYFEVSKITTSSTTH